MNHLGKITLITPPDKLFNLAISYLLVKPSIEVKHKFQSILCNSDDDINVFIFDDDDYDIDWLLSVAQQVDIIIIDIDNCDLTTKTFVSFLLAMQNTHYITNDELTPYNLISRNRIYDFSWMVNDNTDDNQEDE